MRSLLWADKYFPDDWFSTDKIDDDEKYFEVPGMIEDRKERASRSAPFDPVPSVMRSSVALGVASEVFKCRAFLTLAQAAVQKENMVLSSLRTLGRGRSLVLGAAPALPTRARSPSPAQSPRSTAH